MVNFLQSPKLNRVLVSCVLASFTLTTLPAPVYSLPNFSGIGFNDVRFVMRIEKLIGKINKYRERGDCDKLLETMIDLKIEVEGYTGKKINLDKELSQIEKDIKAGGGKLEKDEMKRIRKIIKQKEKRVSHKAMYMASCLELDLLFDAKEEHSLFLTMYSQDKDKDDNKEVCVPLRVTIGVTVALCGLFLFFVPFPPCKVWGPELMKAGVALAIEGTINRAEENEKEKKK